MIRLSEEEIIESGSGLPSCRAKSPRAQELHLEAGKRIVQAQIKKIVDEAKKRGVFSVDLDGLVDYVSEDITGMRFWSELLKELKVV